MEFATYAVRFSYGLTLSEWAELNDEIQRAAHNYLLNKGVMRMVNASLPHEVLSMCQRIENDEPESDL